MSLEQAAELLPPGREMALDMFRRMLRIRHFEQQAYSLYMSGKLPGFMHSSIGQEATAVGACTALKSTDYMSTTHRGHGDAIAKGLSVESAMAELFGKATGACHAKGGSMHIADFSQGILGANGIVAAGIPIAAGAALTAKFLRNESVALAFFGDGATAAGPAHETMNIASLWKLPLILVRQNNLYAQSTPLADHQGIPDVVTWAQSYGIPALRVDGNSVLDVQRATLEAVDRARRGGGPTFIESETYRWHGHNIGEPTSSRPREEVAEWKARDPIERLRHLLLEHGLADSEALANVDREESLRVANAVSSAEAASAPPLASALDDLYTSRELAAAAIRSNRG
jgi:acetoin:2,6-dichlorophenolindophenol oxidoreductase subunit alpha